MPAPLVLVVRHGKTALNDPKNPRLRAWENPPLSREGQLDAQLAAQTIKKYAPQMVYSSDLARDAETGLIISQELGNIPFDIDYDLRTADMGDLSGEREDDVEELVDKWYTQPWWPAPGGESNNDFLRRFYPAFDRKFALAKDVESFRPSVVVTHGRNCAALHARCAMIPQIQAQMPFPGGAMSVYLDERGDMQVDFLTGSEPVHADI